MKNSIIIYILTVFFTVPVSAENTQPDRNSLETKNNKQDDYIREKFKKYLKDTYNIEAQDSCPAETKEMIGQNIKTVWQRHSQSMISGNLEHAYSYFSVFTRDEQRRSMSRFGKSELKKIFSSYKAIEINTVDEKEGIAECGVLRDEGTETFSYPAAFMRDPDCVWRIRGY
jgi:hypothetical protein